MATSSDIIFYRYSPEIMPEDILRKLFVGREKLLESLVTELENSAREKTPRFYLIVGPRGIGKSHFLVLLYYEIKNKLGSLLIPIKLSEEEYSVFRASDLFLRILEEKREDTSDILSLKEEDEILHAALEKLKQASKKDEKSYIIFIENLHVLFGQLNTEELQKLRSIFQRYDIFSAVASAPMIFPGISEHDEPFYNFFQIQYLGEFSLGEIKELIQKIAAAENNKKFLEEFKKYEPKIHGMAHLTGGSPRLVILFYEMITRGELENVEKAFLKIIDEHTPYYQEIFQLLTGQRRRIFDVVISSRAPITPKLISEEARIDLPTVTTQLRRMETDGYIISRPMGRHTYYEVRERLFRLWREMRQPFGRKRVSILIEFLKLWYTPEELEERFKAKFELLEAGEKTVLKDLCYYAEILPLEFKAEALLKLTPKLIELGEREEAAYEIQKLKETAARIKAGELEGKIPLYEGLMLLSEKRYDGALEAFSKALEINPKNKFALSWKVLALVFLGRYGEVLEIFNQVLEISPNDEYALLGKGLVLGYLGRYEEALETYNKALEINPKYEFALSWKGAALVALGRYEQALETYNKALEINPKDESVLSNKGDALVFSGRYEEALETFNKVLEINPKNEYALSRKGASLVALDKHEEALETFNKVLEINPKNGSAMLNKGAALGYFGRYEEALETFNTALEINPKNEYALLGKGLALGYFGRYEEALETFNKVLEINPKNEYALSRKGASLVALDKHEEALETFNKALEIKPKDESVLSKKGAALGYLGRYEEALEAFNKALATNPNYETALRNKSATLLYLKMYAETLDAAKRTREVATCESSKIDATLILIKAYMALNRKTDAFLEIEKIENKIANQESYLIENFIEICFGLALGELKAGNPGNSARFIERAYNAGAKLKEDKVAALTMNFFKGAADSRLPVVKEAVDEIIKLRGDEYRERIRPIIKAIEIIETRDMQRFYGLQVEEREIVADIVKRIDRSDELLPDEIKRKEDQNRGVG